MQVSLGWRMQRSPLETTLCGGGGGVKWGVGQLIRMTSTNKRGALLGVVLT